ncbi:MAG: FAD-dependent oxidoreductase [Bacteroidota bacterium]
MIEINIILNGKVVKGNKGETILAVAKRNGFEIPSLCNDDRLEPFSSCYICVVEVEGMRGLQPACSTKIAEGMKVETNNSVIFRTRKAALELMLSNHYADCIGPCKITCPAGVDVQGYISYIEKGMHNEAVALIKETNPLPAICGRVCVRPCEVACRRNLLGEGTAVGIDYMKRFVADFDLDSPNKFSPDLKPSTGKKIAIIGGGPAGLSAAFFLQKEGHSCDIYEASPKAGGWLRYGIPEYRLPNDLLQREVDNITELGVNIFYNRQLGENLSYKALKFKYDSIILAIGSQKGTSIGCEGDDAPNVLSGIDFLKKMEITEKKYDFKGKKVAVIGGGNTAMDCCRTSLRCGAEAVSVIYRRTEKEMPANPIEIHESKLEGVEYKFLTAPVKVNKDENGNAVSITCIKMGLGEPDASGRRRPVPVPDSDFEVEVDYVLAAIGQKTIVEFINDVNRNTDNGELKINKWGDLDADPLTLQTGVKRIFAAGDGVTGPATLIQAIAQAKVAARSCHQYLLGQAVEPEKKEFLSKKDNFKIQAVEEYMSKFFSIPREEMPTIEPSDRNNFNEVELGYSSEEIAMKEALRCLECGCSAYHTCDLKKYSTIYEVDQKKFKGEFENHEVDFRHPFIEIDNNKCILCARCVRICKEVVGANALGLVDRGFGTFVAPSLGNSLIDTQCESCGLCLSTCPTGALSENVTFKPGPIQLETIDTICNYCSVGCSITRHHKNGYVMKVTGKEGKINTDGNICRLAKFGYSFINDKQRLTKPLLRVAGKFKEISFIEALDIIAYKIKSVMPDQNAFFAGARLSNEEMYLVQKLARYGAKTNNVNSFHYLGRGNGYINNTVGNTMFDRINGASKIFLMGSEINNDNAVVGFMISNLQFKNNVPLEVINVNANNSMKHKADESLIIKNYYYFIKAVNHYLLSNGLENRLFINDRCDGFEEYKIKLLAQDFNELVEKGANSSDQVIKFAVDYNNQLNGILIFSEKEISSNACTEIFNLAMITGKLGKTSNGIVVLKEKNNSHGIFDMGINPNLGVGKKAILDHDLQEKMKDKWNVSELPVNVNNNMISLLENGMFKNLFIFGEDPIGCAIDKNTITQWLSIADFVMVQDYFMSETAQKAHLIMPASFPVETGGSFTNSQNVIQKFDSVMHSHIEKRNHEQILELLGKFGDKNENTDVIDVMMEIISLLPIEDEENYKFLYTDKDDYSRIFDYGCDSLNKKFEDYFSNSLKN